MLQLKKINSLFHSQNALNRNKPINVFELSGMFGKERSCFHKHSEDTKTVLSLVSSDTTKTRLLKVIRDDLYPTPDTASFPKCCLS